MAVAFARQIVRMESTDPRRAYQQVELLELWTLAALSTLCRQLAATEADPPPSTAEETSARNHLSGICAALLMLALIAQQLKRRLAEACRVQYLLPRAALRIAPMSTALRPSGILARGPPFSGRGETASKNQI